MIERVQAWEDALEADPTVCGFEPNDAAQGCWNPHGATVIRSDRQRYEPTRHLRTAARARPAGRVCGVPRILDAAEIWIIAGLAIGELVHIRLADDHRAGLLDSAHDSRVGRRHVRDPRLGASRRP